MTVSKEISLDKPSAATDVVLDVNNLTVEFPTDEV